MIRGGGNVDDSGGDEWFGFQHGGKGIDITLSLLLLRLVHTPSALPSLLTQRNATRKDR